MEDHRVVVVEDAFRSVLIPAMSPIEAIERIQVFLEESLVPPYAPLAKRKIHECTEPEPVSLRE